MTQQTKTDSIDSDNLYYKETKQTKTDMIDFDICDKQTTQTHTNRANVSSAIQTATENKSCESVKANHIISGVQNLLNKFSDVFDVTKVGRISQCSYDIKLQSDAVPVIHASRKVPFTLINDVTNELKRMEQLGVIAKVETPTQWVNSMVIVEMPNKTIRICLDPANLNKHVMREHTHLPTIDEMLSKLSSAKIFDL